MCAKGKFITFEGGEGSGKSTQIELFAEYLRSLGHETVVTREPGGTETGRELRRILVQGDKDKFDELTEALLYYADRRIHLTKLIWPAIEAGKIVLSDRFNDSTIAYQFYGAAKFAKRQILDQLYQAVAGDFLPDKTFLLDIDVKQGLARSFAKAAKSDVKELRFENAEQAFHERLRAGYLEMAKSEPQRFVVIDAGGRIDEVQEKIRFFWEQSCLL